MKPISTKVHGMLDYSTVGLLMALAQLLPIAPSVKRLLRGSALVTLLYSIFTRYELGLVRVLPMEGHLALDTVQAASLAAAPFTVLETTREEKALLVGLAAFEAAVVLNSQSQAPALIETGAASELPV